MDSDRIFFVTTVTIQRLPIFRREANAKLLIDTLAHYRDAGKFLLHEFVIMPDHIHAPTHSRGRKYPWSASCNLLKEDFRFG